MGSIRVRASTGKLFFDFRYRNIRCREQTALIDTPANLKKLTKIMDLIDAEILLGRFDYQAYFPESKILKKLKQQELAINSHLQKVPTLNDFFTVWFTELEIGWRRSYKKSILSIYDNHIGYAFSDRLVNSIDKPEILQFRAEIAKQVKKNGEKFTALHVNQIMKLFKRIMCEAADRHDFNTPFRGIKHLKTIKPQIEPFALEEVMLIINNVRADFKDYYTVRFFTGMRTGEVDGLKWQYVDFDKRQICVREALVKGYVEQTKTDASLREIVMSQPVYDALKRQFEVSGDFDYVFCLKNGKPLDYCNVTRRVWKPILRYLGLKERRAYQTRHTAATLWLASGENPEWIARQLGHANTEMLFKVYSRYVPNLTRQDGSAFEKLLNTLK
jgi:integrase